MYSPTKGKPIQTPARRLGCCLPQQIFLSTRVRSFALMGVFIHGTSDLAVVASRRAVVLLSSMAKLTAAAVRFCRPELSIHLFDGVLHSGHSFVGGARLLLFGYEARWQKNQAGPCCGVCTLGWIAR